MDDWVDLVGPAEPWSLAEVDDGLPHAVGMWDHDIAGGRLFFDRRALELHGLEPDQFGSTMDDFYATICPADLAAVRMAVDAALEGRGAFAIEYRVARPDGSLTWVQGLGRAVAGRAGRATRSIGVFVDVTWRRSMVDVLQRAVLPSMLPDIPGVDLVARYQPTDRDTGIGGDWFDAVLLPDGAVFVTIGDVAGHGLPAVATMAELRHAARAYAFEGHTPAQINTQLGANLAPDPDGGLATAVVARLVPATRCLTWSCAGHPPPLLVAGGSADYLDDVHGPTLGADPSFSYDESCRGLPAGGRLLLYTDGLVERRDSSITDRLEALAATALAACAAGDDATARPTVAGEPPQPSRADSRGRPNRLAGICDRILATVEGDPDREDDLCLLALAVS